MKSDHIPERIPERVDPLDLIRKRFEDSKEIKITEKEVQIVEMQINAIRELVKEENEIFSQIEPYEVFDVARALCFSSCPLPSLQKRLDSSGIGMKLEIPLLTSFIRENFRQKQKLKRKRTDEYLEGLKSMQRTILQQPSDQKQSMLRRLI